MGRNATNLDARLAELSPRGRHSKFVGDVASVDTWARFEEEFVSVPA